MRVRSIMDHAFGCACQRAFETVALRGASNRAIGRQPNPRELCGYAKSSDRSNIFGAATVLASLLLERACRVPSGDGDN